MIVLDLSLLFDDVLVCLPFCWCPCMAINVSVQYDGGFLPDIILLTQCYLHQGTCLNAMKRFSIGTQKFGANLFQVSSTLFKFAGNEA